MIRKGYALTAVFFVTVVVLAISFSGIFDVAAPRIQKAEENTKKLVEMLDEIRDVLNMLRIQAVNYDLNVPSKNVLNEDEFNNLTDRDVWFPSIVEDVEFEFSGPMNGESVSILVTCELHEWVEIYPHKIDIPGITVDGNEVRMLIQYRKGTVM